MATKMISPYEKTYNVAQSCIRYNEQANGVIFHPGAAKRVAEKCHTHFGVQFSYSPSCVDRMQAALNAEIIYSRTVNRIDECCGGYRVLVGWQEWMLFREGMT